MVVTGQLCEMARCETVHFNEINQQYYIEQVSLPHNIEYKKLHPDLKFQNYIL